MGGEEELAFPKHTRGVGRIDACLHFDLVLQAERGLVLSFPDDVDADLHEAGESIEVLFGINEALQ